MNLLVKGFLNLIKFYQRFISPFLRIHFGVACRYYPSCSEYFSFCLKEWGFRRGLILGILRILRCHPFFPGGYDPPPQKRHQSPTRKTFLSSGGF